MPVQLFQEEGFKKTNLRQLLFQNFNLEEEQLYEVMSAIADKGEEAGLQNGMKYKVLVDSWME
jgi:glycine betaine/proline transport system substrate-binding protein